MHEVKIGDKSFLNSLEYLKFTYEDMREFVTHMPLGFNNLRNDAEKLPAPNFVSTFYTLLMKEGLFTQAQFWDYYSEVNKDEIQRLIGGKENEKELREGLKSRCDRAYPSIMRDLFFSLRLKSEGWDVLWNPIVDTRHKSDVVVRKDGVLYGVALYTDTKNARMWREAKLDHRTSMAKELTKIELSIDMKKAENLGEFKAYGPVQIKQLEEAIAKAENAA